MGATGSPVQGDVINLRGNWRRALGHTLTWRSEVSSGPSLSCNIFFKSAGM